MIDAAGKVLTTERIEKVIQWPLQSEQDFQLAVDMIDNGSEEPLRDARVILERLISQNPKFDPAYVELARVAMKSNWGPEGLHQAETLLDSALQIRPDSVNARILLGYVYAHQRRFKEAEPLFVAAARSNPPNLWLWTNWGELYAMQGDSDRAIAKYREAINRPPGFGNYQARSMAYAQLLALLKQRQDDDGMEVVYRQRIAEFGPGSCYSADYAVFKLNVRGDPQGAMDLARGALNLNCEDAPSRQILGLAGYVQWAQAREGENADALNQARVYLPIGPTALYLLARSDKTIAAVKKLVATGEAIDQKDNEQMTALAHALENKDFPAAERLIRLGARPDTPVGFELMPVALLPVVNGDVAAVRIMQRAGVDYSKLRYHGATALDFAKQIGDDALLEALTHKGHAL
jgi:tetratricopeptide (TPR) repeat protein